MIHNLRGLGDAAGPVDCSAWGSLKDFFNWNISNSQYLADGYQCLQYGSIPALTEVNPGPSPAAPQTRQQMTVPGAWTPEQSAVQGSADYTTRIDQNIQTAQDSGTYNPAGNLPISATGLDQYKWLIIAAAVAAGLVVLKVAAR